MQWFYSSISIRFINTRTNDYHSNSGVSLSLKNDGKVVSQYYLTINVLPQLHIQDCEVYITNDTLINKSSKEVKWLRADIDYNINILKNHKQLFEYLTYFNSNGFSLLPLNHNSTNLYDFSLINLALKNDELAGTIPINLVDTKTHDQIKIHSYPFNFTNPIMFSNFQLNGTINQIAPNGYLTDIKYIDNILGAVVMLSPFESVGLVMTNLRKFNGDGDLIFILDWSTILSLVGSRGGNKPLINKLSTQVYDQSVLPVEITVNYGRTWGSCVIFSPEYLITNYHVIKPFVEGSKGELVVWLSENGDRLRIGEHDTIFGQFKEIDLVFIKLSFANQLILQSHEHLVPIEYSQDYGLDDDVTSVGYGLLFNNSHLAPIQSFGKILAKQYMKLQKNDEQETASLVISSSSCWNGSSGGGLFKNNKFIGLICSNAQVRVYNPNTSDLNIEKLPKLSFILPIDVIIACLHIVENKLVFDLNFAFKNSWNLIENHRDTYTDTRVSRSKL